MTTAEKTHFALGTLRPMAEYTLPYLTSIIGVDEGGKKGKHIGSAFRCAFGNKRVLVTAWHVIDRAMAYPRFAASAGYGVPPFVLGGEIHCVQDESVDLALCPVPDDYPKASEGLAFWPAERVAATRERLDSDYLFLHGFPCSQSAFSWERTGVVSASLPFGVMQRLHDLPSDLGPEQFVLDFDPQYVRSPNGASGELPDPHGLSGSPVWRIGASGHPVGDWDPGWSLLVGIATQWREKEKVLVATQSRAILDLAAKIGSSR